MADARPLFSASGNNNEGSSSHYYQISDQRSRFHTVGGRNLLHDDSGHALRGAASRRQTPQPGSSSPLHRSRPYDRPYPPSDYSHPYKSRDRRSPSSSRNRHSDSSPQRQPMAPLRMSPPRRRSVVDHYEHVTVPVAPGRRLSEYPQPRAGGAPYWHTERADHSAPPMHVPPSSRPLPQPGRKEDAIAAGYFQKPQGPSSKGPFGAPIGADHPPRRESNAHRRSISHSPIKSTSPLPNGTTDHARSYLSPRDSFADHRPMSPTSDRPGMGGPSGPVTVSPKYERLTAGPVASFFRRPPGDHSRQTYGYPHESPAAKDQVLPEYVAFC